MSIANIMSWNMILQSLNRGRRSEEHRRQKTRDNAHTFCGKRQIIHPLDDYASEIHDSIVLGELYTNAIKAMCHGCDEEDNIHD